MTIVKEQYKDCGNWGYKNRSETGMMFEELVYTVLEYFFRLNIEHNPFDIELYIRENGKSCDIVIHSLKMVLECKAKEPYIKNNRRQWISPYHIKHYVDTESRKIKGYDHYLVVLSDLTMGKKGKKCLSDLGWNLISPIFESDPRSQLSYLDYLYMDTHLALGDNYKLSNWILYKPIYEQLIKPNESKLLSKLNYKNLLRFKARCLYDGQSVCIKEKEYTYTPMSGLTLAVFSDTNIHSTAIQYIQQQHSTYNPIMCDILGYNWDNKHFNSILYRYISALFHYMYGNAVNVHSGNECELKVSINKPTKLNGCVNGSRKLNELNGGGKV